MLARSADGAGRAMHDEPDGDEGGEPDAAAMGKAALKATWDSLQSGDVDGAWDSFCAAVEHCQTAGYPDEEPGGDEGKPGAALLLMGKPKGR